MIAPRIWRTFSTLDLWACLYLLIRRCSSCLNNSFNCVWHLLTAQCIDRDLQSKMNSSSIFLDHVDRQCPRFNTSAQDIFVADGDSFTLGEQDSVRIRTMGMKTNIQKHLRCALTRANGSVITSPAVIKNDLLTCDAFKVRIVHSSMVETCSVRCFMSAKSAKSSWH